MSLFLLNYIHTAYLIFSIKCTLVKIHEQPEAMKSGNMVAGNQQKHLLLSFATKA